MTTVQNIERYKAIFRSLSQSRQKQLTRIARDYVAEYPHMADVSNFWRGLSARHILSVGSQPQSTKESL